MTISSTASRVVCSGNGSTTTFPFTFYVGASSDLAVTYTDTTGTSFVLSPAQYALSAPDPNGPPAYPAGGTLTYQPNGLPMPSGSTLTIQRVVVATQPTALGNQGAMWPRVIENALDRVVAIAQGFIDQSARSLQIMPTDGTVLNPLPSVALRRNTVLGFDADGQPVPTVLATTTLSVGAWLASTFLPSGGTRAAALGALGAAGTVDNNVFSGVNTVTGNFTYSSPSVSDFTGAVIRVPLQSAGDNSANAASTQFVQANVSPVVRQTVRSGPVDGTGLPTFLPASASGLNLNVQNLSSTYPLVVTAANGGASASGAQSDMTIVLPSTFHWTLPDNSTSYLYIVPSGATFSVLSTTVPPLYQWAGTPSTTNGQFTFNIGEMRGYLGNGTTAPQTNAVFVGEAVTSGGNVTSTVMYAYNGAYDSSFTATLPASATVAARTHNIGVAPRLVDFIIENTTGEAGYSAGDQLHASSIITNPSSTTSGPSISASGKTMGLIGIASSTVVWSLLHKSTGALTGLTNANWKYKLTAQRGW